MNTNIQDTHLRINHDCQANLNPVSKESQDSMSASTTFSSGKELKKVLVRSTALSYSSGMNENKISVEKASDQKNDDYNGINNIISRRDGINNTAQTTAQHVRAAIIDAEAESSSNATTLMLLMIGIMAGFQRANMTSAISTLQSIVAKIKTRIDKMTSDKDSTYLRDMFNVGAELLLNGVSLCVTAYSVSKIEPMRKQLISEQNDLAKSYEYESLKTSKSAVANSEADASGKIKSSKPLHTPDEIKEIDKRMNEISGGFPSGDVPASFTVKSKVDILQTQIAYLETRGQCANSVATALKGILAIAVAILNKDASTAKVTAEEAEMEKAQLDVFMRQFIEQNSIFRDTIGKFLNEAEQMQNLQSSNSTAVTHRISG